MLFASLKKHVAQVLALVASVVAVMTNTPDSALGAAALWAGLAWAAYSLVMAIRDDMK